MLKSNGVEYRQPLTLQPDPRVKAPPAAYQQAYALARQIETARAEIRAALKDVHALHASLQKKEATAQGAQKAQVSALDAKLVALADLDPEDARNSVPKSALSGLKGRPSLLPEAALSANSRRPGARLSQL